MRNVDSLSVSARFFIVEVVILCRHIAIATPHFVCASGAKQSRPKFSVGQTNEGNTMSANQVEEQVAFSRFSRLSIAENKIDFALNLASLYAFLNRL